MTLAAEGRIIVDIVIAYLMALPVGWEREHHERSAGLRTFPLVCVASCALALVSGTLGPAAQSRILQGLVGGIGFIGGGTILRAGLTVHGTATAASILVTAVIGISVAQHLYVLAAVLSILSLVTLRLFQAWRLLDRDTERWRRDTSN